MPKTQVIKGGMCGGFRIGSGGNGTFSRFGNHLYFGNRDILLPVHFCYLQHCLLKGRAFGRVGHCFKLKDFQHGWYFCQNERGRTDRYDHDYENRYSEYHGRQIMVQGPNQLIIAPSSLVNFRCNLY